MLALPSFSPRRQAQGLTADSQEGAMLEHYLILIFGPGLYIIFGAAIAVIMVLLAIIIMSRIFGE